MGPHRRTDILCYERVLTVSIIDIRRAGAPTCLDISISNLDKNAFEDTCDSALNTAVWYVYENHDMIMTHVLMEQYFDYLESDAHLNIRTQIFFAPI